MFPPCLCFMKWWLTENRYQRAFVNYFEDELVRHGYDWKEVVNEYLFSGEQPLFNSLITDRMSLGVISNKRPQLMTQSATP